MQRPLQITFHGMEPSEFVERRIQAKAADLERLYGRIMACHVTVDAPHRRRRQGNVYTVRISLQVPDQEIVVGREHRHHPAHEDVYVAVRDAFDAAARQIEDYVGRRHGHWKIRRDGSRPVSA